MTRTEQARLVAWRHKILQFAASADRVSSISTVAVVRRNEMAAVVDLEDPKA